MNNKKCDDTGCVMSEEAAVQVRNLSLSYGKKTALTDLNIDIQDCEVTALIGPSGSGKTSFLQCLNRMTDYIEHCKVVGSIAIDGHDILSPRYSAVQLRKKIGMIFQKPNPFPMSIRRNISMPLKYHGVRRRSQRDELVEEALVEAGLWDEVKDRLDESAAALSGGQQQRLCIARAICLKPDILLMDEPCSALDPGATQKVEQLIQKLRAKYTVVIVTHNLPQAQRLSDQTAVFWSKDGAGYLVEQGKTKDVFLSPRQEVAAAYIAGHVG